MSGGDCDTDFVCVYATRYGLLRGVIVFFFLYRTGESCQKNIANRFHAVEFKEELQKSEAKLSTIFLKCARSCTSKLYILSCFTSSSILTTTIRLEHTHPQEGSTNLL